MSEFDTANALSEDLQDFAVEDKPKKKRGRPKKETAEGESSEKKEKKPRQSSPRRDNIAYVSGLNSIFGVRKFIQTAKAKKAKAKGNEASIARYDSEIQAGIARLEELLRQANMAEDKIAKLVELDEEPNRIITAFLKEKELEFAAWLNDKGFKEPKGILKKISDDIPESFTQSIPELQDALVERQNKKDFRMRAICKKFNLKAMYEAGLVTYENGKWAIDGETDSEEESSE